MVAAAHSFATFSLIACLFALPSAHGRPFTDDQGRQVEAELVGVRDERVVLAVQQVKGLWPIARLSPPDQQYVREWQTSHTTVRQVTVRAQEREGIGERGEFRGINSPAEPPPAPLPLPVTPQTETRTSFRHYEVMIANPAAIDASYLRVAYVIYVINPDGTVGISPGDQSIQTLPAGQSSRIVTEGVSATRTKTKRIKLTLTSSSLTTSEKTVRSQERFGGIWVRVFGPDGGRIGEHKLLSPELAKMDPPWQEAEVREDFRELRSLGDLLKLIQEALPPVPSGGGSKPAPPPFPPSIGR